MPAVAVPPSARGRGLAVTGGTVSQNGAFHFTATAVGADTAGKSLVFVALVSGVRRIPDEQ